MNLKKFERYPLTFGPTPIEFLPRLSKEITIEGADLAYEIGPKILKEFKEKEFPLLFSVIKSICNNQKLEINW